MIRLPLRIGKIGGTHQEYEKSESGENGKSLSKSHSRVHLDRVDLLTQCGMNY
jgi:hypothetical protein